ncbi:lipopolysaccharide biosynthesis protein [Priestia endophytica]|uniref:lipopolysaccharide biosynthesis protein n=1 Tax=Priestia endophytica TaxID=135735 RepID=UPI003D28956A
MNKKDLSKKITNATKWSTITEIIAKLIVPITNMILARLLTPEAFGVVAAVNIILSFADMLTDSGFQKYLIQHEFKNKKEEKDSINVAFWTNLSISVVFCALIIAFCQPIASWVGNPGLGEVVAVASFSLLLTALSSIQMAVYKRYFDFKTLFFVRIIGVFIPLIITIPLALVGLSYWALIIGTLFGNLVSAILLTIRSQWKPSFFYNFLILRKMFSFSIWSLAEAISIWATTYIGTFIVASSLSSYYLGIYNTTILTVNGILAIATTAVTSVLFSSLSRLQKDDEEFKRVFLQFIRISSIAILPLGVGIFIYRELLTNILLGNQWKEASLFVGLWGLVSSVTIIFGQYCSEVYRSKGKPKLSLLVQLLHLIALIPTLLITVKFGFDALVYGRSLIKIQHILVNWAVMYIVFKFSPFLMIKNVIPTMSSAVFMGFIAYILHQLGQGYIWDSMCILFCTIIYFLVLSRFSQGREDLKIILKNLKIPYKGSTDKRTSREIG